MKKMVFGLLAITLPMFVSCEKEVNGEGYPEMEGFYVESCGLPVVTIDSVKLFSAIAVTMNVDTYPLSFFEKYLEITRIVHIFASRNKY